MSAVPDPRPMSTLNHALACIDLGWALCSIRPGTKGPNTPGWNKAGAVISTREAAIAEFTARPENGIGLIHSASGTCAIDVDSSEYFDIVLAEYGLDLEVLFANAPRIIGRGGRDKAIFRVPADFDCGRRSLAWPAMTPTGKPTTVFELRGGDVQDVLPPTIHPDTLRPYLWRAGTEPFGREIPELPEQLLALWRAWDAFKPQLLALCPWAPKESAQPAPAPRVRTVNTEHGNVIGQFNEAHDVGSVLEAHGYVRKGKRYLSPTSSSKLAGVVVLDGTHCYSHHASDPLNDGHSHDAFSLYCHFEHGDDVTRAVRSAAELLHVGSLPDLPIVDVKAMALAIKASRAAMVATPAVLKEPDLSVVPGEITRIPGALGYLVDHTIASSIKPQRVLAVTAALAFGGTMMGRVYASITDLRTNLFLIGVAPSTAGKDHGRRVIKAALAACGKKSWIGGEEIKSGAAVMGALGRTPNILFQLDEFGLFLQSVMAPGAGSFQADIVRQLMQVRTSANSIVAGAEYADQAHRPKKDIEYPCAIVHGTTTGDSFWPALTSKHVLSGFLNRFLITHSENPTPERKRPSRRVNDVPVSIIEWGKALHSLDDKKDGNLQGITPENPIIVGETAGGASILETFNLFADQRAGELLGSGLDSLWGRAGAMAVEVAMVVAGSINPDCPIIDEVAARWAVTFVHYWTARLVADVSTRIVDPEFGARCAAIVRVLAQGIGRDRAYSDRDIGRHWLGWRGLKPFERDEAMTAIVRNGDATEMKRKGARGPATRVWIHRDFAPDGLIPSDD